MLEKLMEAISIAFRDNAPLGVAILASLVALWKVKPVLEFIDDRSRQREKFIRESLTIDSLGPDERALLTEELNAIVFKRATDIAASAAMRAKLRSVLTDSDGTLQLGTFSRARQFLIFNDGLLQIRIPFFAKLEHYIHWSLTALFVALASISFAAAATIGLSSPTQIAVLFAAAMLFIGLALSAAFGTVPVYAARQLEPKIKALQADKPAGTRPTQDKS